MNKLLALIAATLVALTAIASTAEAGHHGHGFFRIMRHMAFHHHHHEHPHFFARRSPRRVIVVEREAPARRIIKRVATEQAVAEPEAEVEQASDVVSENSSIATAENVADASSDEKPVRKVAASNDLGCKSFFPSVGMTVSVPCE